MSLQKPCFRHHEGNVVQRSRQLCPIQATGTWVCPQTDGVKKMPINFHRDIGRKQRGIQAPELVVVRQSKIGVVGKRQSGERRKDCGWDSFVLQNGSNGLVVHWNWRVHKGAGCHEVPARGLIRLNQNVGSLAGGNENGSGCEGFCVDGVDLHDGERVTGDGEEELVIKRSIDDP